MKGRICLITGASSGIGKATAQGLAKLGAQVVLIARDRARGEAAQAEIQSESENARTDLLLADLSSQKAIHRLAVEFQDRYDCLHVLINNAGVAPTKRVVTEDGIELAFAVNYLAPFLLTNLLLETLKADTPTRVINVAGDFHRKAHLDFDDLMLLNEYNGFRANNQSKLALISFTYELARRLDGTGVTVNALHPGAVATDSVIRNPDVSSATKMLYRLVKPFFLRPEQGAETSIYLASSPDVEQTSGMYFIKKKAVPSSRDTYDLHISKELWEISLKLTGLNN